MPDLCDELHFRGPEWILFGKVDVSFKETPLTKIVLNNIKFKLKRLSQKFFFSY